MQVCDMLMHNEANIAARLERDFNLLSQLNQGPLDRITGLEGFELIDVGKCDISRRSDAKAITVRNVHTGDIFVHFNGTGDGNWAYNSVAYGGPPSEMQEWALSYFNRMVETHNDGNNLYVTGHSQGGNNAQFVTIRSPYGDQITGTVALNAPGFSDRFVEESKGAEYGGEARYEVQCGKIWAFNTEHDYVSTFGQTHIIPPGQTRFVKYSGSSMNFGMFHDVKGMMSNGSLNIIDDANFTGSDFRKLVEKMNAKIVDSDMPPNQQARLSFLGMKLFEDLSGGYSILPDGAIVCSFVPYNIMDHITQQQFEEFKSLLIPIIIEVLSANENMILPALESLGFDNDIAKEIERFIGFFNKLPHESRQEAIGAIANCMILEDGKIKMSWGKLNFGDITTFISLAPYLAELYFMRHGDFRTVLQTILEKKGVPKCVCQLKSTAFGREKIQHPQHRVFV